MKIDLATLNSQGLDYIKFFLENENNFICADNTKQIKEVQEMIDNRGWAQTEVEENQRQVIAEADSNFPTGYYSNQNY